MADCSLSDDCVVRDEFLIVAMDPASNAYVNAYKALSKSAGSTIRLEGRQDTTTGQFDGAIGDYVNSKKKNGEPN
jgi:hypothetical protein